MNAVAITPEFVRWALPQPCPLREIDRWEDPEQTERQLRPLRAYCEAVAEGRLFEGICVDAAVTDDPAAAKGFLATEILDAYGGTDQVQSLCRSCPANALKKIDDRMLAGCYGMFELAGREESLQAVIEAVVVENNLDAELRQAFLPTMPRWNGLWADSPLEPQQVQLLARLLSAVVERDTTFAELLRDVLAALQVARQAKLQLHVAFVPKGEVVGEKWIVAAHCARCRTAWREASRRCVVCNTAGPPQPSRRRNVRGNRPYWRLSGFLGPENVEPFLERYQLR